MRALRDLPHPGKEPFCCPRTGPFPRRGVFKSQQLWRAGVPFLRNILPQGKLKFLYKQQVKNLLYIKKDDDGVGGWMDGWVTCKVRGESL